MTRFYDIRHEFVPSRPKTKMSGKFPVKYKSGAVTGIVLHQTAAAFAYPKGKVGDELALARRSLKVSCHAMAFRAGFFVAACPLDIVRNHGNGFNSYCYGLEVDGLYSGLEDDPTTLARREDLDSTWQRREPTVLTDETVMAARAALEWLVKEGRARGNPVEFLYAHRQSSATRRSDPGEGLWRLVALEYALPVLGLRLAPALALPASQGAGHGGRPVPREWDPVGGVGRY